MNLELVSILTLGLILIGLLFMLRRDDRADSRALRAEVRAEIQNLRTESRAENHALRAEVQAGFQNLREEVHAGNRALRAEVHADNQRLRQDVQALTERTARLKGVIPGLAATHNDCQDDAA